MHVYTVSISGERTIMHVEAETKAEARRTALANVEVERLTGSQVIDLTRRGIAIVSAKSGRVCNRSDAEEAAEQAQS